MSEPIKKTTRGVRRNIPAKAASSPEPEGVVSSMNSCGHGGCGSACRVRYVGQTSHLRDHYAMHAARGVTHVWSAAIIAGLAVVLTGAVGYSVVQARENGTASSTRRNPPAASQGEMQMLRAKLDEIQRTLESMKQSCNLRDTTREGASTGTASGSGGSNGSSTDGGLFNNTLPAGR